MLVTCVMKVIVIGVLKHAFVEEGPCKNVLEILSSRAWISRFKTNHCILLVLGGLNRNFSQEIIVKHMHWQMRLKRQAIRMEFFVEVLSCLLAHEYATAVLIF